MARTIILGDRPVGQQFEGAAYVVEDHGGTLYGTRRVPCGCYHMLRILEGHGPTTDGSTHLCDEHAIDEDDEAVLCPPMGWAIWNLAEDQEHRDAFLAERKGVGELLAYWATLAARPDDRYDDTGMLSDALDAEIDLAMQGKVRTLEDARNWADRVLFIARKSESNPPNAGFRRDAEIEGTVVLTWYGTWTQGRFVWIQLFDGVCGDGSPCLVARLEWNTGTGQPSRFLSDLADIIPSSTECGYEQESNTTAGGYDREHL